MVSLRATFVPLCLRGEFTDHYERFLVLFTVFISLNFFAWWL